MSNEKQYQKWMKSGGEKLYEWAILYIEKHWHKYRIHIDIRNHLAKEGENNKTFLIAAIEKLPNEQKPKAMRKIKSSWSSHKYREKEKSPAWINVKLSKETKNKLEKLTRDGNHETINITLEHLIMGQYGYNMTQKKIQKDENERKRSEKIKQKDMELKNRKEEKLLDDQFVDISEFNKVDNELKEANNEIGLLNSQLSKNEEMINQYLNKILGFVERLDKGKVT